VILDNNVWGSSFLSRLTPTAQFLHYITEVFAYVLSFRVVAHSLLYRVSKEQASGGAHFVFTTWVSTALRNLYCPCRDTKDSFHTLRQARFASWRSKQVHNAIDSG